MSAQHTESRIVFHEDGDANHWSMLTEDGRWWLALLANGEQTTPRQIANFRRLAACWNACEGLSTEALERLGTLDRARVEQDVIRTQTIAQRDELLAVLQEMVAGDAEAIKEAEKLGVPFPEELLTTYRKACAAIAKATGRAA